jgi:ribosomal protein L24E
VRRCSHTQLPKARIQAEEEQESLVELSVEIGGKISEGVVRLIVRSDAEAVRRCANKMYSRSEEFREKLRREPGNVTCADGPFPGNGRSMRIFIGGRRRAGKGS